MKAIITTKYLPATNYRCSRVKAYNGAGESVTLNYDHRLGTIENHQLAAGELADKLRWHAVYDASVAFGEHYIHIYINF